MQRSITLHKTSLQGMRESNEDVEKFKINLCVDSDKMDHECAQIDFFAVCDGHGGSSVAKFIAPKLEKHLTKKNLIYPLSHNYICKIYNYIQQELINHPQKIAKSCGSTALVVVRYLDNDHKENIQVINSGDCRAVLSRKGLAIPLSKDHKPFWPDEKYRIDMVNKKYNTNKRVHYEAYDWRIGDLSVSKSFGDLDNTPYVSHLPDSFHYQLQPEDEFIIVACDGLWDVLQNHEAINFVRDHWNDNNIGYYDLPDDRYPSEDINKTNNIARKLASYAIARGSTDNVSILVVFFIK